MKTFFISLLLFNSFFCFCQSEKAVIKVYLEDAYTGKNITDAKVTLEGFKKAEIKGKYDKEGEFYYFTKIPKGYNTVMAYHKAYNEKGFQNTAGLPNELRLKLYTPYRVKIPNDTINSYFEDSFKLAVLFNDTLLNLRDYDFSKVIESYFKKHYPQLKTHTEEPFAFFMHNFNFYVTKKNGKPFKRFNDPIVHKIENDNKILMTFGVLLRTQYYEPKTKSLKTFFTEDGTPVFLPQKIAYFKGDDLYERYIARDEDPYFYYGSRPVKGIKDTITNVPDLFLSYKQKYKKGLLNNHVYTLNEKEETVLYQYYKDRSNRGYLYNFRIDFDSEDTANFLLPTTITDVESYPYNDILFGLPYVFVSNILKFSSLGIEWDSKNSRFTYSILYETSFGKKPKADYEKYPQLIEKIKNKDFSEVFKLRNINASPLGIMDIMEHLNIKEIYLNYIEAY